MIRIRFYLLLRRHDQIHKLIHIPRDIRTQNRIQLRESHYTLPSPITTHRLHYWEEP